MVGGPSEVFASSGAAFCGMRPHGYKSLTGCRKSMKTIAARQKGACYFCELLGLQGVLLIWASWPSGRVAYMGFLTFWACCFCELLGLRGVLLLWASWSSGRVAYMGCKGGFSRPIPVVRINSEQQEWISNCFSLRPANVVSLILDKRIPFGQRTSFL